MALRKAHQRTRVQIFATLVQQSQQPGLGSSSRRGDAVRSRSMWEDVPPWGAPEDQSCCHKHLQLPPGGHCETEFPYGTLPAPSVGAASMWDAQRTAPGGHLPLELSPWTCTPPVLAPQEGLSPARCQGKGLCAQGSGRERTSRVPVPTLGLSSSSQTSTTKTKLPPLSEAHRGMRTHPLIPDSGRAAEGFYLVLGIMFLMGK